MVIWSNVFVVPYHPKYHSRVSGSVFSALIAHLNESSYINGVVFFIPSNIETSLDSGL